MRSSRRSRSLTCPECGKQVSVNGVGPQAGFMHKFIYKFVHTLFPRACRLFEEAADRHDLNCHIYSVSKVRADRIFLRDMLLVTKNVKLGKCWFRSLAYNFYAAVKVGGKSAFEAAKKSCGRTHVL